MAAWAHHDQPQGALEGRLAIAIQPADAYQGEGAVMHGVAPLAPHQQRLPGFDVHRIGAPPPAGVSGLGHRVRFAPSGGV